MAPALGVELTPINMRDAGEIERGIAAFARSGNGGLILTSSALAAVHRELEQLRPFTSQACRTTNEIRTNAHPAVLKFLTGCWQDGGMKKVPHFAGTLLAIGTVVVALNSGPTVPVESAPIKASVTAPLVGVETTRLFSAVRMDDYPAITAPAVPAQPRGSAPEIKVPAKKPTATQQPLQKGPPKSKFAKTPNKQPALLSRTGHIL